MRRFVCLLLAVSMVLSAALCALAEDETVFLPRRVNKLADALPGYEKMPKVLVEDHVMNPVTYRLIDMQDPDAAVIVSWADEPEPHALEMTGGKAVLALENPHGFTLTVEKNAWTGHYNLGGECLWAVKKEQNTDYFRLGKAGSTGYVTYRKTVKDRWYVSEVNEIYSEGRIASVTAAFAQNGELLKYWLAYRTDEKTVYVISYSPDDEPVRGLYGSNDRWGNVMTAYTNTRSSWREPVTGELTDSVVLDWELEDLSSFAHPPRRTK